MLSAEGCRQRRLRLWQALDPKPDSDHLRLGDPMHLVYLANFFVDPFSLGAGFGGYLLLRKDGHATVIYDNRLPNIEPGNFLRDVPTEIDVRLFPAR